MRALRSPLQSIVDNQVSESNVEGGRRGLDCTVRIVNFDHRTNHCRRMTQSMMVLRLVMNQRRSPDKH